MFPYSKQSIIDLTFKKTAIIITFLLLINPFIISQNTSDCFLFEISELDFKNSKKGAIKKTPRRVKLLQAF